MHSFPLPANLPRPLDDGAANHLPGLTLPHISLPSTQGHTVNLATLPTPRTILFCYPMTGVPGTPLPDGWDEIPGARGCTPQNCSFRDLYAELLPHATIFGLSTQPTAYQRELADRLHLPYEILSDEHFHLTHALRLPTFEAAGTTLLKRITLILRDGRIEHVLYPVFPPNESAAQTLTWLQNHPIDK